MLFLSCNCSEVDDICIQSAGNDETTNCWQLLLRLADGQPPSFFYHANETARRLDNSRIIQATYSDEDHKRRDVSSMIAAIRQEFNTLRDNLEGKFLEIGIEGFLDGIRLASNRLSSRTISKVRLGIVRVYSRLVQGLRTLFSLPVQCFFMMEVRCNTFEEYRS